MLIEIERPGTNGNKFGRATAYRAITIRYQEIKPGVFLLSLEKFEKGKVIFPDEQRALYLISSIARGKVVFWPKSMDFLEPSDFLNGRVLDGASTAKIASGAGIDNYDSYVWYKVADMSSLEVLRSYCC